MTVLPAVSLAAVPGRRRAVLELAREIERQGFAGIKTPILVPSSAHRNQMTPFAELFAAFAD